MIRKRILIIDDDLDMLEMLQIVFQDSEYDIVLSNKGMDYNQIQIIHPDLMLLDVRIEGYEKTGAQICKELKTHNKALPVLLMSAEENLGQIASDCNADDYLSKPFDIANLRLKIKDMFI